MSQVLALKYRPQVFDDVVGQETTVRIFKNILQEKRIHHASLLTGPRGVGKTSLARIFAKAVNCDEGPTIMPCGRCVSCREIAEGRSLSVLEIDGASNTSVDDVRELRERIRYLPPGGRYKIYIIDEVHMLSTAAFNALLKTLEEPPPHALFVFATTEPQKLPVTVTSRCLRFDLRPLTAGQIVSRLRQIAARESIEAEDKALFEIAREAAGGLRDALGLLDQAAALSGRKVSEAVVGEILGGSPRPFVAALAARILRREAKGLLEEIGRAMQAGIDPKRLATELLEYFRHLLVVRVSEAPELFDLPSDEIARLKEAAGTIPESSLDQIFRMLQQGISDLLRSASPQVLLDVLLMRLCHYDELQPIEEILRRLEEDRQGPSQQNLLFDSSGTTNQARAPIKLPEGEAKRTFQKGWAEFLQEIRLKKPQLHSILEHEIGTELNETEASISFPVGSIYLEMLKDGEKLGQLQVLMTAFFGREIRPRLVEESASPKGTQNLIEEAVSIFQPRSLKTVRTHEPP